MIDVRVRKKHMIDGLRRDMRRFPIQQAEFFGPLKHAAVNQETSLPGIDQIF